MFVEGSPSTDHPRPAATAAETRLADVPLELIEREIEQLAARVNAGAARWLELLAEFDRRGGWGDTGCRSTSEWVAWRCGLTPRSAREHVRVARALAELPRIRERFARGELSYSKVRALTRVAATESEADLLELARHATAAQLDRIVRAARRVSAAEADEAQRKSYVRWHWDDADGCLRLDAKLPPEDGALFLRALEAARDTLHQERAAESTEREGGSAEPQAPPPSPTNAESLVALAEAALARPPTGIPGGERYQVLVHVDAATLATDEPGARACGPGECAIADGPGISPETARRLSCDASLVRVVERDGVPLSVGRRTRTIPPALRRALLARDGRCQFPGCERRRFVDAHHIVHWAHGGETKLGNLVLVCRHHHRLLHEGGYTLTTDHRGRRRFRRPDGAPIPEAPLVPANAGLEPAPGSTMTGSGEGMDLRACVDAVLAASATAPAARGAGAPG